MSDLSPPVISLRSGHMPPPLTYQGPKPLGKGRPPGQMPPFSLSTAASLVQAIVSKQHERQVDYDKRQQLSAGTRGQLVSGGSGRAEATRM